ncbi:MAG: ribosome maturation factor RimM [Leptolyngbyaceae bacterium]|nr:ribosome maturation factor RimM [Leptolyngbyaceae bacterium]
MANLDDWLEIGRIVAPQGLTGEVRVYPSTDFPERFLEPGQRWILRPQAKEPEPIHLLDGRYIGGKGLYVLQLDGIRYRDQAEKLRDSLLLVPVSDRPHLEDDEYHVMDLLGVQVFHHHTGELIGTIKDVIAAGNDLLEVELVQPTDHSGEPEPELSEKLMNPEQADPQSAASSQAFLRRKGRRAMARKAKIQARPKKSLTILIPFVPEIVPVVDLDAGRIAIAPPPGLLEELPEE